MIVDARGGEDSPLVSIIIPCYNAELFVGEAIESALGQTYPNVEIIVIDDGSTDGSLDVISSFGDRIRWDTGPNRGGCAARNRGIELARGKFIQFLDADDLLYAEKIEKQVVTSRHADVVLCRGIRTNLEGQRLCSVGTPYQSSFFRMACLDTLTVLGPLHRKDNLVAINGFDSRLPLGQERDLHVRLALLISEFHYVDETLFSVRMRPDSTSANLERSTDIYETIFFGRYQALRESGDLTEERAEALAATMVQGACYYIKCGAFKKAQHYFDLANQMHASKGFGGLPLKRRLLLSALGPVRGEKARQWLTSFRAHVA